MYNENFIGYINEVRIWNVARTQAQIQAYMNTSLPSPATQPGLLAYYIFDDLLNKQGNPTWNGTTGGSAVINQMQPDLLPPLLQTTIVPGFNRDIFGEFNLPRRSGLSYFSSGYHAAPSALYTHLFRWHHHLDTA